MSANSRRQVLKKLGVAGASIGTMSIAGCAGGSDGGDGGGGGGGTTSGGKNVKSDLPKERKIGEKIHLSNTERYWAARYQANVLVDKWMTDKLGLPVKTKPIEFTTLESREQNGEFHFVTYNWCTLSGDPDNVLVDRFRSDGARNYTGFSNEKYDKLATKQRQTTDRKKRQEIVYQCQKILGEQRPEHQYLHNVYPYAYNNQRIDPDSVIVNVDGLKQIHNWTSMKPLNKNGRELVTNNWDPTDSLNPINSGTTGPSRNATPMSFMHDFLMRPSPDLLPKPWAAKSVEWADNTTINVTLKDGMKFHDGEDVTIDDVMFTYNLLLEKTAPAFKVFVNDTIDNIEKTGSNSMRFNLIEPYAPFEAATLSQVPILPQHYWENAMSETGTKDQPWKISFGPQRKIIGSGPFQYGTWDQGSRFVMPAFKDHKFAAPNIDTRIQRPLDTRDAELQAMKNGEYDLLDYWFGSPKKLKEEVSAMDKLTLVQSADDCRQACWNNVQRPPFDDVTMRQAINALIMQAHPVIKREIYDGFGKKAFTPIPPTVSFWHNPDTPWFEGGVDAAETMLSDAGYAWDQDGNLYYPEGETGE